MTRRIVNLEQTVLELDQTLKFSFKIQYNSYYRSAFYSQKNILV